MPILTIEQAQQKDWACIYWPDPDLPWCYTTGVVKTAPGIPDAVEAAVVIFPNDPANATPIALTELEARHHMPGVIRDTQEGERTAWWSGRQDADQESGGVIW